ncbi:hypothetical protein [Chryseobacterium luquanense]|uniref:Lipoprotein n=1 Tax=Chryseobacterium luquanense TaxID=2983766 RepID=A0ABT3Y4G9_9FLAO|nr:hypothetical protein [Chryseobacterium luquanense]MCX8533053.1 hypothetical protein [Chryseobacterium luquanense]
MKILILISTISIAFACRSKHKIINDYKEKLKETENVKVDSVSLKKLQSFQNESTDLTVQEKKNEMSGNISIKGKSDESNPFVFHNVVGNDTVQSISIMGTAEYLISNHYAKYDNKKSEVTKQESATVTQDFAHRTVLKETKKEVFSEVNQKTKEIKAKGFQAGTWIVITIGIMILILTFFIYKYLKK